MAIQSSTNTFGIQVCDTFEFCQVFYSPVVEVRPSANITQDGIDLLDLAKKYNTAGDPISALSILSVLMKKRNQSPSIMSTAVQRAVEYSVESLVRPSLLVNKGQVTMVYHVLGETLRQTDSHLLQRRALDAIHKMTHKAFAFRSLPDLTTIDSTLYVIFTKYRHAASRTPTEQQRANIQGNDNNQNNDQSLSVENEDAKSRQGEDLEVFAAVRNTVRMLLQAAAAQVPLGSKTEFGKASNVKTTTRFEIPEAYTVLIHDNELQDLTVHTHYNATDSVEAKITFGDELRERFAAPWTCNEKSQKLCHSVVYSITLYPHSGPYAEKRSSQRLTPIVEVVIYSPHTGDEQTVKGYLNAITLSISTTGTIPEPSLSLEGNKYRVKCYFWNEAKQAWKTDGVHSSGMSHGKHISCDLRHVIRTTYVCIKFTSDTSRNMIPIRTISSILCHCHSFVIT